MSENEWRPNTLLGLPQGLRSKAYRGVVEVLMEAPSLVNVVATWRSRAGSGEDMEIPASGMLPMIALSPRPMPDTLLSNESATVNFVIAVEVWAEGSCVDDLLNLWDAVCEAMRMGRPYREGNVQGFLRCGIPGVSIINPTLREPAFFEWLPSGALKQQGNPAMQWGLGQIAFFFQRPR